MWYRSHCYRVQTPASVTGIFICIFLTDTPQSFIKVGLFCSGSVDVTALSLENDSVWQQQANRCRRSAQSAKSLVTTWCGGWKLQVCVDICVCVCLARPFIHQKSRTKHKAYRDEMFPTSRGWGMWFYKTRYNTYSFCSLTLCVFVWGFFYSLFFFGRQTWPVCLVVSLCCCDFDFHLEIHQKAWPFILNMYFCFKSLTRWCVFPA